MWVHVFSPWATNRGVKTSQALCRLHFHSSFLCPPSSATRSILEDMFWDIYTLVQSAWDTPLFHRRMTVFHSFICFFFSQHALRYPTHSHPIHPPTPFLLLKLPLLSIPPSLLGSGVSNQCLSCLIPPRCCALCVCVCVWDHLHMCVCVIVSLYWK